MSECAVEGCRLDALSPKYSRCYYHEKAALWNEALHVLLGLYASLTLVVLLASLLRWWLL